MLKKETQMVLAMPVYIKNWIYFIDTGFALLSKINIPN